jgi:hypothetical protein
MLCRCVGASDPMSGVPDDKLEPIAATLCNGQPPKWAIDRLQHYSYAVRSSIKDPGDSFDRSAFEAALNLQIWLTIEARTYDKLDQACPV